jgi:hypothetical protein
MAYNKEQFRDLIYRTLRQVSLPRKKSAIDLLMGTAAQESAFGTYLRQTNGPALGAFQMEPATFETVVAWAHRSFPLMVEGRYARELEYDLDLAIISARLNYLSKPGSIPEDVLGQAEYWKRHWNTYLGAGTIDQYMKNWKRYCA